MRARWTGRLAVTVLAVGGYLYLTEWSGERREGRVRPATRVLQFEAGEVDAIDIDSGGMHMRVERVHGVWSLTVPIESAADPAVLRHLLSGFDLLERQATISRADREATGQGLDAFGLDRPRARWTFWTPARRQALWMGRPSPDEARVYLFDENTEDVIAVRNEVLHLLPDAPDALRDRTLFTVDPFRVHRLELARPEGFVQFSRDPAGEWRLQQPFSARADPGAIRGMIALMADARATGFVRDGPGDDTHFGFDETAVSVALSADRPEAGIERIEFGFQPPDRTGERYARMSDRPGIFTVSETVYRNARTGADELRDRRLVVFGPEEVREIEIRIGSDQVTLRLAEEGWMLDHPVVAVADRTAVDVLLVNWAGARIEHFSDTRAPEDGERPDAPVRSITFRIRVPGEPEDRAVAFRVYPPGPDGLIPVQREGSDHRGAIHPLRLRGFSTDPAVYVSSRPLRLDPESVRGFTTRRAQREWSVMVMPDGRWTMTPDSRPLDPVMARNQLALLLDLPTVGVVSFGETDDRTFGLEEPTARIRIHVTEAAGSGKTLAIGRGGDNDAFVRVGGQGVVYGVDPVVADTLLRPPVAHADSGPDGG